MDAVVDSKPETFNRKAEITKTTELIRELTKAEECLEQQQDNLWAERRRLYYGIDGSMHRMLRGIIHLRNEICRLEIFPCIPYGEPMIVRSLPFPTDKELAEPMQRTKIKFQHNNKNLATERKMAKELQQHERERHQQLQIKADFALREAKLQEQDSRYHHRRRNPFPKSSLKSLIVMWAEKIEVASSLVIRDSKNVDPTWESDWHLRDLMETSKLFYSQRSIDKDKFGKHWNSMRETRKSIKQIDFELMKERRRHAEGYAEIQCLTEKEKEIIKLILEDKDKELRKIRREKSVAREYLLYIEAPEETN